jgi:hypothetical protein
VTLDTSTAYVNTLGTASIGRFSVKGGKLYKLQFDPQYVLFSGVTGLIAFQWADVTLASGQVLLGGPNQYSPVSSAVNEYASGAVDVFYAPGGGQNDVFLLEVQIIGAPTVLTQIGSATKGFPTALIETY